MKTTEIIMNTPAAEWTEALPVGNGRMGAMLYGNLEKERIALNEDSLWSGNGKSKNRAGAHKHLAKVRELLASGEVIAAEDLYNREMLGDMCETYMPLGDIIIEAPAGKTRGYKRQLDMKTGVATVEYKKGENRIKEELFASYPAQLIVFKYSCSEATDFCVRLESKLKNESTVKGKTITICGQAPESALPTVRGITPPVIYGGENSKAIRFCGIAELITEGKAAAEGDGLRFTATEFEIRISLATDFDAPQVPKAALRKAEKPMLDCKGKACGELLSEHKANFKKLYGAVSLSLAASENIKKLRTTAAILASCEKYGAAIAETLFNYGRYLLISCSRPGSHAANLQGVWNESVHPAWCSNYTININTEMNYWAAEKVGLGECALPLVDFISALAASGEKTAAEHYGCRGWVSHCNSDIRGYSTSCGPVNNRRGCSKYAPWTLSGGWLCLHLWEHYKAGKDSEFLEKKALPLMLGAARFYLDFGVENEKGEFVLLPSVSPENSYYINGEEASFSKGVTMDSAILREFFAACLEAGKVLGLPQTDIYAEIKNALARLPEYKTGSDGRLLEWDGEKTEAEPHHRHISHLFGLYPGKSISLSKTPELAEAARKSLYVRGLDGTGWSIIWKCCCYAALGEGETCEKLLETFFRPAKEKGIEQSGIYPNLFLSCPPFQIDANFGIVEAIINMLVREENGEIKKLPALPKAWKGGGKLCGVRIGGKKINVEW